MKEIVGDNKMKITASTDDTITFFLNGTPRVVSGIVIFQYTNINPLVD